MDPIKANQRLGLIAKRILALPPTAKECCLAEIGQLYGTEQLQLIHANIHQQQYLQKLMSNPDKMPLSNAQLVLWSIELTSGSSKNEVTSSFIEGTLDQTKLEHAINDIINELDIFNFRVNNWLPFAKRLPRQKIKLVTYYTDPQHPLEPQIDEINKNLATIDLRQMKQNIYPCLIIIDENKALLQLVVTHKSIDAKTKTLLWHILWLKYHNKEIKTYTPYRDYIHTEKSYYANIERYLQQHIEKDYGQLSPCHIDRNIIDNDSSIKNRLLYSLNETQVHGLKAVAHQHQYTLDELIISATLKAFKTYSHNNEFIIQLISQPLFYSDVNETVGPCLNERFFGMKCEQDELMLITEKLSHSNRESLEFYNIPYGAGLGWLYYFKYKKIAPVIRSALRIISSSSKYMRLSNAGAECYAGLILYEFLANKNKEFPLLSFNFRNVFTGKSISGTQEELQFKPYLYPFYKKPTNYVSINIDTPEDNTLVIHLESYFKEEIDKKLMDATLANLNHYLTLK